MFERFQTLIIAIALSFCAGWYANSHQDAFFAWLGGVGKYWQIKINQEVVCPNGLACQKLNALDKPTPSPSP